MTSEHWTRLADLVPDALACPPDKRDAFLDRACTDAAGTLDPALRREAAALVAAADAAEAEDALQGSSAWHADAGGDGATAERIGPWLVTGRLGEGGMGVVYRARRDDGLYQREVALKRLHPALASSLAGRLDAERQTLARLEHDGVARLYDGGVDATGAPYLVMELVDGVPLTDFATAEDLGVEARVRLFVQVCEAVAYAHSRLVVHRDLKPSNVFVTTGGTTEGGTTGSGGSRVKLLDFGIAKLLDPAPADEAADAVLTQTRAALTPQYAAPEQVQHGEVTTATDVYALGVMLFELLAGQRPYTVTGLSAAETERVICETVPPLASSAAPAERARALRGDLDTIVAKALSKEPARRYASAEALAADLQRHLDGLPVLARPASRAYRARLFVRRHRAGVAAAALVAVALVAGAAVALWQARVARAETAKATAVNEFLLTLFDAPNPETDGRDVRVASLLDQAADELGRASRPPGVEAALRLTLGNTYRGLGLYDEAAAQLDQALALRTRLRGAGHPDVAEVQASLGRLYTERGEYDAADSVLTLALATAQRHLRPNHVLTGEILNSLGQARYETGDFVEAVRYYRASLAIDEATRAPSDRNRLTGMENVALALYDSGEKEEGLRMMEQQVALTRRYHPDNDYALANNLANLGSLYYDAGRREDAARLQREAVVRARRAKGDAHPDLAFALNNLGSTLGALDRNAEAEPLLREAVAIYSTAFGDAYTDHPDIGFPLVNLSGTLLKAGQPAEAAQAAQRATDVFRLSFGDESPLVARTLVALGEAQRDAGRTAEAIAAFREALAIRRAALPEGHPLRAVTASHLGDALRRAGQRPEAERLLTASHAALVRAARADTSLYNVRDEAAARLAALRSRQTE